LSLALEKNALGGEENAEYAKLRQARLLAVFRYVKLEYESGRLCTALEAAEVPFIPLKGSIMRKYYPEEWMRTSCDIDVLVHDEDLARVGEALTQHCGYRQGGKSLYDVAFYAPGGQHIEMHFNLVEEWYTRRAVDVLYTVWEITLTPANSFRHEMTDAFFYLFHITHMARHVETGGCGIRPFMDLWILERIDGADQTGRDKLLAEAGLLQFAQAARKLSRVWFCGETADELSRQMEEYILNGGVYGTSENRVMINQKKRGGRLGYLWSRMFVGMPQLKRSYPILNKYPWLMPVMQIRRWFKLRRPDIAERTKRELLTNSTSDAAKATEMKKFRDALGL
jgi:hypothetical protein